MPLGGEAPEYSRHLGRIRTEQFQAALDRFGLGSLVRAEPIGSGITRQNCFVSSSAGRYVLRGGPLWPNQFAEERFLAEQVHLHTQVPAPWPYLVDDSTDIFGWSYALMPRLPGLPWPDFWEGRDAGARLGVARALGRGLALLQELRWPFAGAYDASAGAVVPFPAGCEQRVIPGIRKGFEAARALTPDQVGDADLAYVEGVIGRAEPALRVAFEPRFVMPDYKEDNVVLEPTAEGGRVCGVFDLGGHFGDGEAALARQRAMYLERDPALAAAFVGEYLAARPPRPGFAERLAVYQLNERLEIWEWARRTGVARWDPALSLRAWLLPFVE